jgi:hypothetical protein
MNEHQNKSFTLELSDQQHSLFLRLSEKVSLRVKEKEREIAEEFAQAGWYFTPIQHFYDPAIEKYFKLLRPREVSDIGAGEYFRLPLSSATALSIASFCLECGRDVPFINRAMFEDCVAHHVYGWFTNR